MEKLDYEKVYSLYELEQVRPTDYIIIEKNHPIQPGIIKRDRYKIVEVIENIKIHDYVNISFSKSTSAKGAIIVEMVAPEE